MHQLPDDDIIATVLQGNTKAYAMLVKRYQHLVYTLCMKLLKNNELAEEATQDAFVKAYHALADFSGGSKFSTWLYTITRNNCLSLLRRHKPEMVNGDVEDYETGTEETVKLLETRSKKELLQQSVSMLPEEEATVITLFYIQEQTIEEISTIMDISRGNVKVKLYRARKRLKEIMLKHFPQEVAAL